ncbi:MAG TPA: glycosyltransferase, partial [bacterium]|nr:glycosyltransferase [bacterium]
AAGATVIRDPRVGKGNMVQTMLERCRADIHVMVDGDDTYSAEDVRALIEPVAAGECEMCIGNRLKIYQAGSFSGFHLFGNKVIRSITYRLHKVNIPDMLSGYRVMSRSLVDELNLISGGFEIETEINIKSVWHGFRIRSRDIEYRKRPEGSSSKLKTISDGYRILFNIFMLLREHQPMTVGGCVFLGANLAAAALLAAGLADRNLFVFGSALFLSLVGLISLGIGIVLHAINIAHREEDKHLRKLSGRGL